MWFVVCGCQFRVSYIVCRVWGIGCRVSGVGFRASGITVRVKPDQSLASWTQGPRLMRFWVCSAPPSLLFPLIPSHHHAVPACLTGKGGIGKRGHKRGDLLGAVAGKGRSGRSARWLNTPEFPKGSFVCIYSMLLPNFSQLPVRPSSGQSCLSSHPTLPSVSFSLVANLKKCRPSRHW